MAHAAEEPVMEPGVAGAEITVTDRQVAELVPQALLAVTHTLPVEAPTVTEMDVVPWPLLIVHPAGTVQV